MNVTSKNFNKLRAIKVNRPGMEVAGDRDYGLSGAIEHIRLVISC